MLCSWCSERELAFALRGEAKALAMAPAVAGGGGRRNNEGVNGNAAAPACVCGFPVCACAGAAAAASAASAADMDIVAAGQIGAGNDESWVAVDLSDSDDAPAAGDVQGALDDRPVFRTEKIKGVLLHPYRSVLSLPPPLLHSSFHLQLIN